MTTPNKPREWWVPAEVLDPHYASALPFEPPLVHVIEYSAYEAVYNERDELLAEHSRAMQPKWMCEVELNQALAAKEDLTKERDEYIERYKSIELANKEMSRNDHVYYGRLFQERDEARAENIGLLQLIDGQRAEVERLTRKIELLNMECPPYDELFAERNKAKAFLTDAEKALEEIEAIEQSNLGYVDGRVTPPREITQRSPRVVARETLARIRSEK